MLRRGSTHKSLSPASMFYNPNGNETVDLKADLAPFQGKSERAEQVCHLNVNGSSPYVNYGDPIRHGQIQELFKLFDFLGNGVLRATEFRIMVDLIARLVAPVAAPAPVAPSHPSAARRSASVGVRGAAPQLPPLLRPREPSAPCHAPPFPQALCPGLGRIKPSASRSRPNSAVSVGSTSDRCAPTLPRLGRHSTPATSLATYQPNPLEVPMSLRRSPSLEAYGRCNFKEIDIDGDGQVDFHDFSRWQNALLDASRKCKVAKIQRLTWLLQDIKRAQHGDKRFALWRALGSAGKKLAALGDSDLPKAIRILQASFDTIKDDTGLDMGQDKIVADYRDRLRNLQELYRLRLQGAIENAATLMELEKAIKDIDDAVELTQWSSEMVNMNAAKLEAWRAPFTLRVMTLASGEAMVDTNRGEKVGDLRRKVAEQLGVKTYRVRLTTDTQTLEPDTAAIDECGIFSDAVDVAAALNDVDRWREMSIAEFLQLAVSLGVATTSRATELQNKFDAGSMTDQQILSLLVYQIQAAESRIAEQRAAEEAAEAKRRATEEAERRRVHELRKAADVQVDALVSEACTSSREVVELLERRTLDVKSRKCKLEEDQRDLKAHITQATSEGHSMLDDAHRALRQLRKRDLQEIKCFSCPPECVRCVFSACCILVGMKPARVKDERGRMVEDYWCATQRLCLDNSFIDRLCEYDFDNIPAAILRKVNPYLESESLDPERVKKCSVGALAICMWIRSVCALHTQLQPVRPLQEQLSHNIAETERITYHLEALEKRCSTVADKPLEGGYELAVEN